MPKSKKTREINVCSNCGSLNVKSVFLMNPQQEAFFNVNNKILLATPQNQDFFGCMDCGYYGISPKIKSTDLEKFQKYVKKRGPIKTQETGINSNSWAVKWASIFGLIAVLFSLANLFVIEGFLRIILTSIYFIMIIAVIIIVLVSYKKLKYS